MIAPDSYSYLRRGLLSALYEYSLVVAPVFVYVLFEAIESGVAFLATSPEWSIATTFLAFQGRALYRRHLDATGLPLSSAGLGLVDLAAAIVIILSSLNAYVSLRHNSMAAIAFRVVLFALISLAFLVFTGASKSEALMRGNRNG